MSSRDTRSFQDLEAILQQSSDHEELRELFADLSPDVLIETFQIVDTNAAITLYMLLDEEQRALVVDAYHPADLAAAMAHLESEAALAFFRALPEETQAEVLPELPDGLREDLLEELKAPELAPVLDEMESDDAADLIQELQEVDAEAARDALAGMDNSELRAEVEQLLGYPEDSAGGLMAKEYVAVRPEMSITEAIAEVRRLAQEREIEDIYTVFVVNDKGRLLGHVTVQDLLLAHESESIRGIMSDEDIAVDAHMDQEELVTHASRYDLPSVPVVDERGVLLGRVTHDDLDDVAREETDEDFGHLAGTREEVLEHSTLTVARNRFPWLLMGLSGGICAALVMSLFEKDLHTALQASFFVPVVMGMGGNVGIQSSTIVVRGLATGELEVNEVWPRLFREARVSLIVGLSCALVLFGVTLLWLHDPRTSIVIGAALSVVMFQASIVGAGVPLLLRRVGIDPAIATGPFITTTNDILGLSVYLTLVALFL